MRFSFPFQQTSSLKKDHMLTMRVIHKTASMKPSIAYTSSFPTPLTFVECLANLLELHVVFGCICEKNCSHIVKDLVMPTKNARMQTNIFLILPGVSFQSLHSFRLIFLTVKNNCNFTFYEMHIMGAAYLK